MRTLALDVGERRVGVAISDPTGLLATPITAIVRSATHQDCQRILELARQYQVDQLVVGLPISLNGTMGPQAGRVKTFVRAMKEVSSLPVALWDERFTTVEAQRLLRQSSRVTKEWKGRRDAAAAALILQAYLDAHRQGTG